MAHILTNRAGPARQRRWRKVLTIIAYIGATLLLPLLAGGTNLALKFNTVQQPRPAPSFAGTLPAPPTPDPSKKIAVVLSSAYGAEITDTLPTFEILARSGVFNVYSVAPERTVLPLVNSNLSDTSLEFIPQFGYTDYEAQIGAPPDLIAIPYFPFHNAERDAAVLDWVRAHVGPNTTILTICAGTEILANTGLLEGRTATTNTGWFAKLEASVPSAHWVHDVRYVDDGNIVTSTNLAAGMDATLHVVDRFAGRSTALDVARQIGYSHTNFLDDPYSQASDLSSVLVPTLANAAFEGQQRVGVLLYDGVSELGLAGLLDPYNSSVSATTFVMAPERTVVQSRNGFLFVPHYDFSSAPGLDRVLVPAGTDTEAMSRVVTAWSASQPAPPVEDVYRNLGAGETAYDATLRDLARTRNGSLAQATAAGLFYATDSRLATTGSSMPEILIALSLAALGATGVFIATHVRPARRSGLKPIPQPA